MKIFSPHFSPHFSPRDFLRDFPRTLFTTIFLALFLALAPLHSLTPKAFAHSGGFDDYGCHHNRAKTETVDYHCHHSEAVANYYLQKYAGEGNWYRADVLKIIDGDSLKVQTQIWLGHKVETVVRIRGIDTPEKGHRARCATEKKQAQSATDFLSKLANKQIILHKVTYDKYGGRVLADVYTDDFRNIALLMVNKGAARFYSGRGQRGGWCE